MASNELKSIGGYLAFPLTGVPGVGLMPRASGSATYTLSNNSQGMLTGTIGLPETEGSSTSQGNITSPPDYTWCLPPAMSSNDTFYSSSGTRTATLSGTWVLVADGSQKAGEGSVPPMYFGSFSATTLGDRRTSILPTNISLRISTLECSVNTPTAINFGSVIRNTQANAELAVKPVQLVATCGQPTDRINANINLQFRAISGLYDSTASRLALNQKGGYITGEIDNGVTGSGDCNATTGLRFDNSLIKLGSITSAESSKTLTNQLTWRLCSGGSSVPFGAVTASTEMLVTFN
ncbi:adhesin [Serratia sp. N21D137]